MDETQQFLNPQVKDQAQVQLRNDDLLHIPHSTLHLTHKLPLSSFPQLWTDFPDEEIKFIRNKIEFNAKLKKYFLGQLSAIVNCNRLLCPDCHLNP